jgi:hypothetical protein
MQALMVEKFVVEPLRLVARPDPTVTEANPERNENERQPSVEEAVSIERRLEAKGRDC